MVETGESEDVTEDVGTRVRPHCDGTGLFAELRYGVVVHMREKQCEIMGTSI